MQTISPEFLDELIDVSPEGSGTSQSIGKLQREGTVTAFNMLAHNRCAYLADEVGMGKTYVALGVMSLLRYFDPQARVIVIAPRQNIQEKWKKELTNFVRNNWKITGNRVKSLEGTPVWEPVVCGNLPILAHEALLNQDRDFFLRMTSFSLSAKNLEDRERSRDWLVNSVPWLKKRDVDVKTPGSFLDTYSIALNGAIPEADLVIVDEAHNLKQGFGDNVSNRNRVMGLAFGHQSGSRYERLHYKPKAKRLLLLSATPFEDDYSAIQRQLEVFGFGNARLTEPESEEVFDVTALSDPYSDPALQRRIVERLLIRRTSGLMIAGEKYTKNMYRREWRKGGVEKFDQPITIDDPKNRLIVALMQKKVSEILQTEKFNNSFQIGMLSSFESFSQDIDTVLRQDGSAFDDSDQQSRLTQDERDGIDSNAVTQIAHSFETRFDRRLPHPKLDQVAETLSSVFQTGEKALVFVRRVATVSELGGKLNLQFNVWIQARMKSFLPDLVPEIEEIFDQYRRELRKERLNINSEGQTNEVDESERLNDPATIELREDLELQNDVGGIRSFFEWFFRGFGPPGVLSGAAFHKNRLTSTASVYSTLFEDNHVAELLNTEPRDTLPTLSQCISMSTEACRSILRELAYSYFSARSGRKEGYPRLYVYESYQVAALTLIARSDLEIRHVAEVILQERFPDSSLRTDEKPVSGFPQPDDHLATTTIFTELKRHTGLRAELWPVEHARDFRSEFRQREQRHDEHAMVFRAEFRRREQRRELFSAIARLGGAYIDLYLLAMRINGTFELGQREHTDDVAPRLARDFVELLNEQRCQNGFHAYRELSEIAKTFDTLVAVNFPDIEQLKLPSLARYFGTILGQQVPVGEVSGQVNKRVVGQFRMPGYPLVLISTDVLQEGEDLHTFCKRIFHYGIAWTPSSIEQRTGRIDRIGGLVQRNLDGRPTKPNEEELIQVFYPHLRDTVELLQVRRVLKRLNQFIELMHQDLTKPHFDESSINADKAVLAETQDVPQYTQPLESAFEVKCQWLDGELKASNVSPPDWDDYLKHFRFLQAKLSDRYALNVRPSRSNHEIEGEVYFDRDGDAISENSETLRGNGHEFILRLKSHVAGEQTLLQCESPIAEIDLRISENMKALVVLAEAFQSTKICIEPRVSRALDRVFVRQEILFHPELAQTEDLCHLFESVVVMAQQCHHLLSNSDVVGE